MEDASSIFLTSISTSFGFTLAALVQAVHGNLSLYQALQATYIVHMANISVILALVSYPRILNSDMLIRFAATFQVHSLVVCVADADSAIVTGIPFGDTQSRSLDPRPDVWKPT